MKMYTIIIAALLGISQLAACQKEETWKNENDKDGVSYPHRYYIDPENGAYYNTGHSPEQAWESVDRIMEQPWKAGDTILIKRGTVYNGTLTLRGSGTAEAPIVLGSYGDESLPLPEIAGGGSYETILIRNVQYWVLQDLKITNKGDEPRAKIAGIRIEADNIEGGVMNHIHIRRCEIADVYGTKTHHNEGGGSGIFYYNVIGGANPSSFNDLVVEDCRIVNCQRDGLTGYLATGDRTQRKANTGFVFRRNVFEGIPGDQIIVNGCDDALVEYNIVRNCAPGDFADENIPNRMEAAAALWCIHSDGTVFRYNIVQDHKATWDGQAFDCDQNCRNTLFEYNISYNNVGGWLMLCPSDVSFDKNYVSQEGTVVRYNVSINDGTRDYVKGNGQTLSSTIDVVGRVGSCHFYNNTIIKTRSAATHADNTAITFDSYTNIPGSLLFTNNIFYNTTATANLFTKVGTGEFIDNQGLILRNNCIYGYQEGTIPGSGEHNTANISADPAFVRLIEEFTSSNNLVDRDEILDGLRLATGSPCIGAGIGIPEDPIFPFSEDFWGEPVGDARNIGAYNH